MREAPRIELLGELRVRQGSALCSRFRTHKAAALVAFLAYHKDRAHPREVLVELLWPESDPDAGRNSLSQALSSLRRLLEPPGARAGSVVLATRATIQLEPALVATDVHDFRDALSLASRAEGKERAGALRRAVELYRGELLPGHYHDWVLSERERLRAELVHAACGLAVALDEEGDLAGAIEASRRAAAADPLDERARRELMRLLAANGDLVGALRQYGELAQRLKQELGTAPSSETSDLARSVSQRASAGAPRVVADLPGAFAGSRFPSGTVTWLCADAEASALREIVERHRGCEVPQGEGFLAAFSRPSDGLACGIEAQRSAGKPASPGLALDTAEAEPEGDSYPEPLVARVRSLARLAGAGQLLCSEEAAALLRHDLDAGTRLADLGVFQTSGVAGSRRVFEVVSKGLAALGTVRPGAQRLHGGGLPLELSRFFGREREITELEDLLRGGARLVTVTGAGGMGKTRLALEVMSRVSRDSPGEVRFVALADIQDASHLPHMISDALRLGGSAGDDPLERVLGRLSRGPSVLVLDNFEQLVPEGAAVVRVLLERASGLACLVTSRRRLALEGEREHSLAPLPTPSGEGASDLEALPSVRLFLDRAQAARPDFRLTPTNAEVVGEIVRRLEGIPLALALVAELAQVLAPEQILARLRTRLDVAARRSSVPERHRTLRAAMDASYELLSPERQRFFARLSVFRGSFTLEAAEEVCEEPLALDALAELRDSSLVQTEDGERELRFRLLETVREYGADELSQGELASVKRRHAEHMKALAERADPEIRGGPGQGAWLDRLAREYDNLRAALDWAAEAEGGADLGLKLATVLVRFWFLRGRVKDGRKLLERALEKSPAPTQARAAALAGAGALARRDADLKAAIRYQEEGLGLARAMGGKLGIARALHNLGVAKLGANDLRGARPLLEEAAALARELGDREFQSVSTQNLAAVAATLGDYPAAQALLLETIETKRALGDRIGVAATLATLAQVTIEMGEPVRAAPWLEEAAGELKARDCGEELAYVLTALASMHGRRGEKSRARSLREETVALLRKLDAKRNLAYALQGLADALVAEGKLAEARAHVEEGLAIARGIGDGRLSALHGRTQGDIASREGSPDAAVSRYRASLTALRDLEERALVPSCIEGLAPCLGPATSVQLLGAMSALRKGQRSSAGPDERARTEAHLARIRGSLGDAAFEDAWRAGLELSYEDAVALALGR